MKALPGTALLAATLLGCGSDAITPPPPPPGTAAISVAVSSNAVLQRSGSANLVVTVHRPATFLTPVDLSISGLGPGVTAEFAPASLSETTSTSTLTLAASAAAATGTFFTTLVAQGGSNGSSIQLLVTVSP